MEGTIERCEPNCGISLSFQVLGTSRLLQSLLETALDCSNITKSTSSLFAKAPVVLLCMQEKMRRVWQRHFPDLQLSDIEDVKDVSISSIFDGNFLEGDRASHEIHLVRRIQCCGGEISSRVPVACEHFISLMLVPF